MTLQVADPARTYTAQEFMALSLDPSKRYELVRGVIKAMSQPGREHTLVCWKLLVTLGLFVQSQQLGALLPTGGFKLTFPPNLSGEDKDTVRAPDLTFLRPGKLAGPPGAITDIPDLAIEVHSPNDEPADLRDKLAQYQAAGWDLVWIVYPPKGSPKYKAGTVEIYHLQQPGPLSLGLTPFQTVKATELLDGQEVIPGFTILVADLFDFPTKPAS